jgi:hypothetical protein
LVESKQGTGRLIYRAWAEDLGRGHKIALKAIYATTEEFYARSAAGTLGKAA